MPNLEWTWLPETTNKALESKYFVSNSFYLTLYLQRRILNQSHCLFNRIEVKCKDRNGKKPEYIAFIKKTKTC